jgi:hypothetical protein
LALTAHVSFPCHRPVAGIVVLGLQGAGTYSLLRTLRGKTKLKLIVLTLVLTWLTIAWVVFQEVKAVL